MSFRWAPAALALAVALAGCLAPGAVTPSGGTAERALAPLTEPVLAFGEFLSERVASFDGTPIHVDVQLPEGEGPFPLILEYTPYSLLGDQTWAFESEHGRRGEDAFFNSGLADYYVPRGYAVGVAHVRGTGESGGCLDVGGPEEGQDGYAVVEALAAEPWSNGKIALVGTSYVGTTPIETAVLQPPHLATIVPMSAVTEWYRYYFENGEQRVNGDPPPGASYPDPALWMALGVAPGFRTGTVDPNDAACVAEYWREYWFQDDYDAFWKARDHGANAANITVPVLYAQGWRDENVATNMIPAWWDDVGAEKRAWFQQHGHGVPGSKEAFYEYQHRWLDHWLLDLENGVLEMPAVVVEDSRGKFRAEDAWPPADATGLRLFPAADGTLAAEPSDPGKASFVDDGSIATTIRPLRAAAAGTTYLAFEGEPLENAMHIAGEPVVHLRASSSAADTQWSVLLYELDEEGKTTFVTRGYLDARHRDSLEKGEDLAPGTEYDFHWRMHPRDHVVEAGHRLQLVVRSSDPYIIPDTTRATNTVVFGEEGSWLEIPAVPMDGRAYSDSAPDPWR